MRRMPRPARRSHKSTGIDVEKSAQASYARISKRGILTIKTLSAGKITSIPANDEVKRAIGAGCWLGETIRRDGAIETSCIAYRTTGKKTCKATRKVKRAISRVHNLELSEAIPGPVAGTVVVPIKSGDVELLAQQFKQSEYLQPIDSPARAWIQTGIVPRQATGNNSHELPVPRLLPEYRKRDEDPDLPRTSTKASSDCSPKLQDYSAKAGQPKGSYCIDGNYTLNELDHVDARDQPYDAKPDDEPKRARRLRVPELADTEH